MKHHEKLKAFRKDYISPSIKERFGCIECGETEGELHSHHIIPRSLGGTVAVVLCPECHEKAHSGANSRARLTKAAMERKVEAGECTGVPPFGQRRGPDGIYLEEHPGEQLAIQAIVELRAAGKSIRAVAAALNANKEHEPRGKAWHATTVARILKAL